MKKIVFGHKNPDTDTICSALTYQLAYGAKAYRLGNINNETKFALEFAGIEQPELLREIGDNEVVLVDHNEFQQSADKIEEAEIVEVYDHHRVANFQTNTPIEINISPVGCTATVLYDKFIFEKVEITKQMAILMISAIISDTLLFKSPTCTKKDQEVANKLEKIAEINLQEYGMKLLKAGTDLSDFSTKKLLELDTKGFTTDLGNIEIGQINTADIEEFKKIRDVEIRTEINKRIEEKKIAVFMFVITDIINNNSIAYVLGTKAEEVAQKFDTKLSQGIIELPGVVSRKKQIVPKFN